MKNEDVDIEGILFPKKDKYNKKEGSVQIVDLELDPIDCVFGGGGVTLDVAEYKYIALSEHNLITLLECLERYERDGGN